MREVELVLFCEIVDKALRAFLKERNAGKRGGNCGLREGLKEGEINE
jgi:hypothetical protein